MTCVRTGELQSEALLAGEEVGGELQSDRVEGAVSIDRQGGATQLPHQDPTLLGAIPNAQHVMHLLRVEHQEVETEDRWTGGGVKGAADTALGRQGETDRNDSLRCAGYCYDHTPSSPSTFCNRMSRSGS